MSASEVTATCSKPSPLACAFTGSATVVGEELVDCYTGSPSGKALRLQFAFNVVWGGSAWRVYVNITWSVLRLSDSAVLFGGSHWCSQTPSTYDKWLAFEAASATQCPDSVAYNPIAGTPLCTTWGTLPGPGCSSEVLHPFFPSGNDPGMIDFDYGSITVS